MTIFRRAVLSLLLLALISNSAHAAESVNVTPSSVLRTFSTNPTGINDMYLMDSDSQLPAGGAPLSQILGDAKTHFLRYPGGEKSDNYLWTVDSNGQPVTTSSVISSPLQPAMVDKTIWPGTASQFTNPDGSYAVDVLDFDEYMTLCRSVSCEPVIVVAYDDAREFTGATSTPTKAQLIASAAAWVKYANITKGYNIKYWSIGNESWFRSGQTPAAYMNDVAQYAAAMKAVDPTIQILAHGNSKTWFDYIALNAGSSVNALDLHDYPIYNWSNGYTTYQNTAAFTSQIDTAVTSLRNASSTMPILITETNAIDWNKVNGNTGWENTNDVGHSLALFDALGQYITRPQVLAYMVWNTDWNDNSTPKAPTVANYLANGGFESGMTGWDAFGGAASISTSTVHSGTKALQAGQSAYYTYVEATTTPIAGGTTGHLEFWGKTTNPTNYTGVGVDFFDAQGTKLQPNFTSNIDTTSWKKHEVLFTAPAGAASMKVWLYVNAGSTVWLDDVIINDGVTSSINSAFTPGNAYQPIGRSTALWGQFIQNSLVRTTSTPTVRVFASKNTATNDLVVWLINKSTSSTSTTLTLNQYFPVPQASRWVYKGTSVTDPVPTFNKVSDVTFTNASSTSVSTLTLDPASITILKLSVPVLVPSITLTDTATSTPAGVSSTLTWSTTNVSLCTASGAWSGGKALNGSQIIAPTATSTYNLTCSGAYGTTTKSLVMPVTPNLIANPSFESALGSWTNWGNSTAVTGGVVGNQARTGTSSGGIAQNIMSKVSIGKTYTVTADARIGTSTESGWLGMHATNASGATISSSGTQVTSTTFQPYSFTYTIPTGATSVLVWTWKDPGVGSYLYVDNMVVK